MLRDIAPKADIVNSRFYKADMNPLRHHSLRASFNDQMAKAGASTELRDYCMGHKVAVDCAYLGGEEGLREAYVKYAKDALEPKGLLSPEIESKLQDVESLKRMFREESKQREQLEARLKDANNKRLKMERQIERLRRGDADIDKIVEVLSTLISAPMGYTPVEDAEKYANVPEEEWFDKPMQRAEEILKKLKERRKRSAWRSL